MGLERPYRVSLAEGQPMDIIASLDISWSKLQEYEGHGVTERWA